MTTFLEINEKLLHSIFFNSKTTPILLNKFNGNEAPMFHSSAKSIKEKQHRRKTIKWTMYLTSLDLFPI